MNSCMLAHAKPEELDRAREEWFSSREARRREREEQEAAVEKRRVEVIRLMRADNEKRKAG
jgi:COX assembly protein 1